MHKKSLLIFFSLKANNYLITFQNFFIRIIKVLFTLLNFNFNKIDSIIIFELNKLSYNLKLSIFLTLYKLFKIYYI